MDFTVLRQKRLECLYLVYFFVCSRLGPNYQRFLEEMKDGSPSVSEEVRWECFCLSDLITIKYS